VPVENDRIDAVAAAQLSQSGLDRIAPDHAPRLWALHQDGRQAAFQAVVSRDQHDLEGH
jgi:hypothetical protein